MREEDPVREKRFLQNSLYVEKERSAHLQKALDSALDEITRINKELVEVYASKRWRITEPLARINKIRHIRQEKRQSAEQKSNELSDNFDASIFCNGKKTIFVMDQSVPQYDKDAGSKVLYRYMMLFRDMGYNVLFMAKDFFEIQPYISTLEQNGVVVLTGSYYVKYWEEWIKKHGHDIDILVLYRPHIAYEVMDIWKKYSSAKIVYIACDLHFLRAQREYAVTGKKEALENAKMFKAMEFTVMYQADTVMVFNLEEKQIIKEEFGFQAITVPLYYFDNIKLPDRHSAQCKNILFVGGFLHYPNVDAVQWFVEDIFPLVKEQLPDVKFYIVGSNPPEEVKDLSRENVIVTGFVTEEELDRYYQDCRVCVIPLRFGAGVKGKTIEAMHAGIPIVSTQIGLEGIEEIHTIIKPHNTAQGFAEEVIKVYKDEQTIGKCAEIYEQYLKRYFSYEKVCSIFRTVFEEKE